MRVTQYFLAEVLKKNANTNLTNLLVFTQTMYSVKNYVLLSMYQWPKGRVHSFELPSFKQDEKELVLLLGIQNPFYLLVLLLLMHVMFSRLGVSWEMKFEFLVKIFFFNPTTASVITETVRNRTQACQWAPGGEYSILGRAYVALA